MLLLVLLIQVVVEEVDLHQVPLLMHKKVLLVDLEVVRYKTNSPSVYPAPSSRTFADVSGPGSNHTEITDSGRYNVFVGPGTLTVNSPGDIYYLGCWWWIWIW